MTANTILERLKKQNQTDLLARWETFTPKQQAILKEQIQAIDFNQLSQLVQKQIQGQVQTHSKKTPAQRATGLTNIILQPNPNATDVKADIAADIATWEQATEKGNSLIAQGKVGAILVAGGQGSRLGFPHPKGMFPIGPVSDMTLFQIFFEQLIAKQIETGAAIPYAIMTSSATHEETVQFLEQNNHFGYDKKLITLFMQGTMPAVDDQTGQLLLDENSQLCLSPDGHGGIVDAMKASGLLDQWKNDGIEVLFYHQVDNPTAIVCDPALIGHHVLNQSEMTTKVARKISGGERMGVLAEVDNRMGIIEYSDMPDEIANQKDEAGDLVFWAGNMAIHVFNRDFLERITSESTSLPFHAAHKKIDCQDAKGNVIKPSSPNAYKFEKFIFDALAFAKNPLVVEANRTAEFNPVKNAEGADSPATAKAAMSALHRQWLIDAGFSVPSDLIIEISPLFAHNAETLKNNSEKITLPERLPLNQQQASTLFLGKHCTQQN